MKNISAYTLILTALLLLCHASFTSAQAKRNSSGRNKWDTEGRADKMTDKLTRELGLSKDQSKQIYAINLDILRQTDSLHTQQLSNKERMNRLNSLNNERNQRFKTVLSAAQYKKWNDWTLNKKEHLEARMEKKRLKKEGAVQ